MNRIARVFFIIAWSTTALVACAKPKADDCKKAVANIRHIYDTAGMSFGVAPEAAVRSCRGGASSESVQCMIDAKTMEDLRKCEGQELFDEAVGEEAQDAERSKPEAAPSRPEAANPPAPDTAAAQAEPGAEDTAAAQAEPGAEDTPAAQTEDTAGTPD